LFKFAKLFQKDYIVITEVSQTRKNVILTSDLGFKYHNVLDTTLCIFCLIIFWAFICKLVFDKYSCRGLDSLQSRYNL